MVQRKQMYLNKVYIFSKVNYYRDYQGVVFY